MESPRGRRPVVDMSGMVLDVECWEAYLGGFAEHAPDYFTLFGQRLAVRAGLDRREFLRLAERDPDHAIDFLAEGGTLDLDLDAYAARLVEEGIRHQVMLGSPRPMRRGGRVNDRVAEFASRYPDLLQAWGCVDLSDPDLAVAEARRCVGQLGMRGLALIHFLDRVDPLGDAAEALYGVAEELGVPLWVHSGHNFSTRVPLDWCAWRQLDAIARRHPDLVILAGHGGWPWIAEMVALCQRHPNLYLEFSTHRPAQMAAPGSGWEPLWHYGVSTIRRKVLFGGIEWVHGMTTGTLAGEVGELPVDERTRAAWLHDNGARLLGLDAPAD